jgi:hypothetical protein
MLIEYKYCYAYVIFPAYKTDIMAVVDTPRWLHDTLLSAKVSTNFADKLRSLG